MKDFIDEIRSICSKENGINGLRHTLILGKPGSGKTTLMKNLIEDDLKDNNKGITIIEPIGDLSKRVLKLAKEYNREVVYFNIAEESCPSIDLFDLKENCLAYLLIQLIPEDYGVDFDDKLLAKLIKIIKVIYGDSANLNHLKDLIDKDKVISIARNLIKSGIDENIDLGIDILVNFTGNNSIEFCCMKNYIEDFVNNDLSQRIFNGENKISFKEAIDNGKVLILNSNNEKIGAYEISLSKMLIGIYSYYIFNRDFKDNEIKPNTIYIDELASVFNNYILNIAQVGRAYNLEMVTSLISIKSLNVDNCISKSFMSNIKNKIILNDLDEKEEEFLDEFTTKVILFAEKGSPFDRSFKIYR